MQQQIQTEEGRLWRNGQGWPENKNNDLFGHAPTCLKKNKKNYLIYNNKSVAYG